MAPNAEGLGSSTGRASKGVSPAAAAAAAAGAADTASAAHEKNAQAAGSHESSTINARIAEVVVAAADVPVVLPLLDRGFLGEPLAPLAQTLTLQTRTGLSATLLGALLRPQGSPSAAAATAASNPHILASSPSLPFITPALRRLRAARVPAAVHIAAVRIDTSSDEIAAVPDFPAALHAARELGLPLLVSARAEEARDVAAAAALLARRLRIPVLHVLAGDIVSASADGASVPPLTAAQLDAFARLLSDSDAAAAAAVAAPGTAPKDVVAAIDFAFADIHRALGGQRQLRALELVRSQGPSSGEDDADHLLVTYDAKVALAVSAAAKSVDVLLVRALAPWQPAGFLGAVPSSVRRVSVFEPVGDAGPLLYLDVCASFAGVAPEKRSARPSLALIDESSLALLSGAQSESKEEAAVAETPAADSTVAVSDQSQKAAAAPTGSLLPTHAAAWRVAFPEAYGAKHSLHPDATEPTFLVNVTENRRLTPETYDRNVFHMEFDISGTALTYQIGDALGVYGHNDEKEVRDFLEFYQVAPDAVVFSKSKDGQVRARTALQTFTQEIDIFGRPAKRFYTSLAAFATDPAERALLEKIASPEGSDMFKARVADTVTYADILREFRSARPSLPELLDIVSPIKPRHYSIASSMALHPNSVHLLVVAVEWKDSQGRQRFGQCTRYLSALRPGTKVTVSIKTSVMRLPPSHTQPVVMAGLGTGMAPFRAFIQERFVAKLRGEPVGPMVLYFGSRRRSEEYLYGEELEAYLADGLVARLGLAFSRDQPQKIYIQHRMGEDAAMLWQFLGVDQGHFYLCGPTWPAGDVRDAISAAFESVGGLSKPAANEAIRHLRETDRYILEVY